MSDNRIISTSKSTDKPSYTILVSNEEISKEIHVQLIVINKLVNKISRLKLIILDGDPSKEGFEVSNKDLFVPGNTLEIQAGYHSDESSIFKGIIIKHALKTVENKSSQLIVECKHEAVKLIYGRMNACYSEVKDSDIFDTIITKYSIKKDIDTTNVKHKQLVQYNCSDWDFIISRVEMNGLNVYTNDDTISIKKPDYSKEPELTLQYGATLLELEVEMDVRNQLSGVETQAWDLANQQLLSVEAKAPKTAKQGNIDSADLAKVLSSGQSVFKHSGILGEEELKAWGDALYLKSHAAKIRGRVKFVGYGKINPGDMIELQGLSDRFNGKAFVSGVRHEMSEGTWNTDVQFGLPSDFFLAENRVSALPASGLLPYVSGLQIGVVTKLEADPAGEDRVLVKLPLVDKDAEGIWARVATLDAGEKRGSFFRPEVDDEVVLGFINDDPRHPVILGMLNSSAKPAPLTASNDNHEKGFITRSEMKLLFNDEKKSITIETPAGKKIIIDEDSGVITLIDDNKNKIEMSSDGISIESESDLNIKAKGDLNIEASNINQAADSMFKVDGSSTVEVTSGGTTTIQGSMVQIN